MASKTSIQTLRAGVIGTGFIGPVHIEALRRLGVTVTAVCGSSRGAKEVAATWGIPEVYGDYNADALIQSPNVDVVHVTSPNRLHAEQALAALRAGKHCICEKPLAMNTRETSAIVKAARSARGVFAVNYNVRFYPAILELRRRVARGELGDIIHVNGSYLQDWLLEDTDYNWRLLPGEGGALRAVGDIGTHWMDTVSFVLGDPIKKVMADLVICHAQRKRPLSEIKTFTRSTNKVRHETYKVETEDAANILLEFSRGTRGNLSVSQVAAGRKNSIRVELYGTRASAWWDSESPEVLWKGRRDEANQVAVRNTPGFGDGAAGFMDYPPGHVEGFPDSFKMLFRSVYGTIANRRCKQVLHATAADGHDEVRVCDAILKSHRTRKWVSV